MWIVIASAATLASTTALAQRHTTGYDERSHHSHSVSSADRKFMEDAARGGTAEVSLGRMATDKATSGDVRAFARMMVDDHSAANDQLQGIASNLGVQLPSHLASNERSVQQHLSHLSGHSFDRSYMQAMVKDHRKTVAMFRKEASSGHDNQVTQWASETLPKLQHHLEEAERLANTSR